MTKSDVLKRPEEHLKGEQKKVYELKPVGPVLVKGGAGSGKTLVAIARARFLTRYSQDLFGSGRVAFFTYDTSLRDEVASFTTGSGIYVDNIDRWVYHYLKGHGRPIGSLPGSETRNLFRQCLEKARQEAFSGLSHKAIIEKGCDFYEDEMSWIKGRMIKTEEEYVNTPRTGRGTADRVTTEDRHLFWKFKVAYDRIMCENGLEMFEDLVNAAVEMVQANPPSERDSFTHVVVDEAQDFTLAKLRLISLITRGEPKNKNITLFADAAQKIYQSGFSWKDANISVQGRSYEFKRNYRNTRQIAAAACSLLSHEEDKAELTEMELPERSGARPVLMHGAEDKMMDEIVRCVRDDQDHKTVVAAYGSRELELLKVRLQSKGLCVCDRGATNARLLAGSHPVVYVRSLHKLKGLQFDNVFVWGLGNGQFPPKDDLDKDASRFRMLLYVAMTRACEKLTLCYVSRPAQLVNEIDRALLDEKDVGGLNNFYGRRPWMRRGVDIKI